MKCFLFLGFSDEKADVGLLIFGKTLFSRVKINSVFTHKTA